MTAVTVSIRNKLDLALAGQSFKAFVVVTTLKFIPAVAVGSSIQIALFVLPFLVILGWCIGQVSFFTRVYNLSRAYCRHHQPLSLNFDTFETIVVVISVIVVNFAISDGRTNWLEGFILMITYVLIGMSTILILHKIARLMYKL